MNLVKLQNLSSCDFTCSGAKIKIKKSSAVIDSTGQNLPNPYNAILGAVPIELKQGSVVIEVFDNAIAFWEQTSCDHTTYTFNQTAVVTLGGGVGVDLSTQSGTTYSLVLADAGKYIRFTNAADITLTVPQNSSVAFANGTVITLFQAGLGVITVGGSGVTINSFLGNKSAGQYAALQLIKVATDEWDLIGGDI